MYVLTSHIINELLGNFSGRSVNIKGIHLTNVINLMKQALNSPNHLKSSQAYQVPWRSCYALYFEMRNVPGKNKRVLMRTTVRSVEIVCSL